MNTIIECPYCRKAIPIVRKVAYGHEVLNDVYCPHCKRSMDIEFDDISNLPYLLAYFGKPEMPSPSELQKFEDLIKFLLEFDEKLQVTGIRIKKSEEQKKQRAYQIRYHESSIDASTNIFCKEQFVISIKCAQCGRFIYLNQAKDKKDVHGLFCDYCARKLKFRNSYEFLSEFYDAEQASLKEETENQESRKQEEKNMTIKSTIIGFVLEDDGKYKIYNPETNQLATLTATDFESLCLGEFPYRKVRANTLANNEVVETLDGKIYYVSDASKNELFDFATGKIERSAVCTNLLVNTNCYVKYVPILKKYCTFADVAAGKVDARVAKILEIISNDVQSGKSTENNVLAKMVRFLFDPDYADLLDTETLNDMVMSDPQAFMIMSQMTNMEMAKSIMSSQGAIPLSIQSHEDISTKESVDESMKKDGEDDAEYRQRLTKLMEEAAENHDYETAAKYQRALK